MIIILILLMPTTLFIYTQIYVFYTYFDTNDTTGYLIV